MTRDEKIFLLIDWIEFIEGAIVPPSYFKDYTDEEIDKELEWYDYLMDK
jgi:hypothetical protein